MWPFKPHSKTHTLVFVEERGTNTWLFRKIVPDGKKVWKYLLSQPGAVRVPANCEEMVNNLGNKCSLKCIDAKYQLQLRDKKIVDMDYKTFEKHLRDG